MEKNPGTLALINIASRYATCIEEMQSVSHEYLYGKDCFNAKAFRWTILNAETSYAIEEVVRKSFQQMLDENEDNPHQTPAIKELIANIRIYFSENPSQKAKENIQKISEIVKDFSGIDLQKDTAAIKYGAISLSTAVIKRMHDFTKHDARKMALDTFVNDLKALDPEIYDYEDILDQTTDDDKENPAEISKLLQINEDNQKTAKEPKKDTATIEAN